MKPYRKTDKREPSKVKTAPREGLKHEATVVGHDPFPPKDREGRELRGPAKLKHGQAPLREAKLDSATLEDAERFMKRHQAMLDRLAKL